MARPWAHFARGEEGATAFTMAISMTLLLGTIGIGMDLSMANKSKQQAQAVADSLALNAAVFWRDHERRPLPTDTDAFMHNTVYNADDVGIDFGSNIKGDVKFKVNYNTNREFARVLVWGRSKTTLSSVFGYKRIKFRAESIVKFQTDKLIAPVSVVIVADNSGSMDYDDKPSTLVDTNTSDDVVDSYVTPVDVRTRIGALESAASGFRDSLEEAVGEFNTVDDVRVARMGMLPYSNKTLSSGHVDLDWGYLTDSEIQAMVPGGSTNSADPMSQALSWMKTEDATHQQESGLDPQKYVVFMTDGMNTYETFHADSSTEFWVKACTDWGGYDSWCTYDNSGAGGSTVYSEADLMAYGWEEGYLKNITDEQTKAHCDALKANDVRIFSIVFALEPGDYYVGDWYGGYIYDANAANSGDADYEPDWQRDKDRKYAANYSEVTQTDKDTASALLKYCASSEEDYIEADDAVALKEAFEQISEVIQEGFMRVSYRDWL